LQTGGQMAAGFVLGAQILPIEPPADGNQGFREFVTVVTARSCRSAIP
jgi:hypothetical protein